MARDDTEQQPKENDVSLNTETTTKPKKVRAKTAAKAPKKEAKTVKAKAKVVKAKAKVVKTKAPKKAAANGGDLGGMRQDTIRRKLADHFKGNMSKQFTRAKLETVCGTNSLGNVLRGIQNSIDTLKLPYELRSEHNEKKEWTVGLYPVR